jgi:hypothetical protein
VLAHVLADPAVDQMARIFLDFLEGRIESDHVEDVEPGVAEVLRVDFVDLAGKVTEADEFLRIEFLQCGDVGGARREHGHFVLAFPIANQRSLALVSQNHEGGRAGGVDDVDADLRQFGDLLAIANECFLELVLRAALNLCEEGDDADSIGQHLDQLFHPAGTIGGANDANRATPSCK